MVSQGFDPGSIFADNSGNPCIAMCYYMVLPCAAASGADEIHAASACWSLCTLDLAFTLSWKQLGAAHNVRLDGLDPLGYTAMLHWSCHLCLGCCAPSMTTPSIALHCIALKLVYALILLIAVTFSAQMLTPPSKSATKHKTPQQDVCNANMQLSAAPDPFSWCRTVHQAEP